MLVAEMQTHCRSTHVIEGANDRKKNQNGKVTEIE